MGQGKRKKGETGSEEELKVTDRRLFTAEGELRSDVVPEPDPPEGEPEPTVDAPEQGAAAGDPGFQREPVEEPKGVDFTMLINAMAEPALLFLGEIQHPGTGEPTLDLERARIQIDMLDLLRIKCRGNLTPEEDGWLDRILYQLRMLYVNRANQPES